MDIYSFLNVEIFMELAERMDIVVVIPDKRYYKLSEYADIMDFRKNMQDSYNYFTTHVKYMNDAREQKMRRGLFGGSALPAPYVIDRSAWKDEQKPLIYRPWLGPAINLFEKFKMYDFSIAAVARYVEGLPYIFPVPAFEDTQRYMFRTKMRLAIGGYTLSDISTVRYYLSNLTLGGYAKIGIDEEGNTLLLPNAFDAAIPFDLLDPAYAAITGRHLDGTPFEGKRNK